jgi:hypothetical protein
MPQLLSSPLIVVFALAVTLLAVVVPLTQVLRTYLGVDRRRPMDASDLHLAPPQPLRPLVSRLESIGFARLGEVQLELPGRKLVQLSPTGWPVVTGPEVARDTAWLFIDPSATIVAEAVSVEGVKPLIAFSTMFADGSVVETMYPLGESIDDPDFHSGHVSYSLETAFDEQRLHVDRWRMRHGTPRPVASMGDYLRIDAEYRERFAKRKLRGPLVRRQLIPALVVSVVVVAVAAYFFTHWPR